uniref:Lariat debranching enzyme C-terminal domain-containing protein n=1 Tax=Trypanosoma congolense (strain IL3000) TaxID=1068625 RepID=G0UMT7_TRYCI|nr:conserved hypothetical protein [Trypanosoma congolense IL3000]
MSTLVHHFFNVKGCMTEKNTKDIGPSTNVHVAVVGCCHGELDKIYAACSAHEASSDRTIDFVICAGDFQALRGVEDLRSMAVPEKYNTLGDFVNYYQGKKRAPYLTLFVGGNHECSDWLAEESYGGFLAPNIYYLGHSSVVIVDGCITVAGISGIFKSHDYRRPYPSRPFHMSESAKRSAYHVRRIEVEKLKAFVHILQRVNNRVNQRSVEPALQTEGVSREAADMKHIPSPVAFPRSIDIFISHDWPAGITKYGDEEQLLRYKPYFKEDICHGALGNPHTGQLLHEAMPQYWISAHLHCRFEAAVVHDGVGNSSNLTNITTPPMTCQQTKFLALDKPAKGKGFIDFVDIPVVRVPVERACDQGRIVHHPLWLEVLRETHNHLTDNDGKWSADSCRLVNCPVEGITLSKNLLVAQDTRHILRHLGLTPTVLHSQSAATVSTTTLTCSGIGKACHQRAATNEVPALVGDVLQEGRTRTVGPGDVQATDIDMSWVEDVAGDT